MGMSEIIRAAIAEKDIPHPERVVDTVSEYLAEKGLPFYPLNGVCIEYRKAVAKAAGLYGISQGKAWAIIQKAWKG